MVKFYIDVKLTEETLIIETYRSAVAEAINLQVEMILIEGKGKTNKVQVIRAHAILIYLKLKRKFCDWNGKLRGK